MNTLEKFKLIELSKYIEVTLDCFKEKHFSSGKITPFKLRKLEEDFNLFLEKLRERAVIIDYSSTNYGNWLIVHLRVFRNPLAPLMRIDVRID